MLKIGSVLIGPNAVYIWEIWRQKEKQSLFSFERSWNWRRPSVWQHGDIFLYDVKIGAQRQNMKIVCWHLKLMIVNHAVQIEVQVFCQTIFITIMNTYVNVNVSHDNNLIDQNILK